ncbi:hypothetical protein [Actinoplanes sp. N902-109]|uniref:hypothetical protein n=1 Tax=Actinoplanes sp. (strain N902-109) TaxID=649831 RepID=UPI0003294CEE|nr:hypothetical protein [Actinoplanes sp. N902-109]AGL15722.1 hypothetical protein L083_2212 [Actinoplanes sp. N902-109]
MLLGLLTVLVARHRDSTGTAHVPGRTVALAPGDCLRDLDAAFPEDLTVVACTAPHTAEVYTVFIRTAPVRRAWSDRAGPPAHSTE